MPGSDWNRPDGPGERRWSFNGCTFDEGSWTLFVDGERVALEGKPLELLRALLARAGNVASREALLDLIWPDVTVVEASLTTAVYKLRTALRDDRRERSIIETVPGIGYRLGVPVTVEASPKPVGAAGEGSGPAPFIATARAVSEAPAGATKGPRLRLALIAASLAVAISAIGLFIISSRDSASQAFSQRDAANALRRLDIEAIDELLEAGWNPNHQFDGDGNGAINIALNICEWDRGHDRQKLLLMVRTLHDGGARLDHRNIWGDTAYSIAKADRYCGSDHPVTRMLHTMCYAGLLPLGDRCLATYELARRNSS